MGQTPVLMPGALADLIDRRRREMGLTIRDIEAATNIPRNTLSRRLRGVGRSFTEAELVLLASLFGKPLSELVAEAEGSAA